MVDDWGPRSLLRILSRSLPALEAHVQSQYHDPEHDKAREQNADDDSDELSAVQTRLTCLHAQIRLDVLQLERPHRRGLEESRASKSQRHRSYRDKGVAIWA